MEVTVTHRSVFSFLLAAQISLKLCQRYFKFWFILKITMTMFFLIANILSSLGLTKVGFETNGDHWTLD